MNTTMATLLYFIQMQQVKELFFVPFGPFVLWVSKIKMDLVFSYINNKLTLITLITIIYEIVIFICWLRSGDFKFTSLYYFPSPSHPVFLSNICCLSDTCLLSNTLLMYAMHLLIISTKCSHVTQNMHNKIVAITVLLKVITLFLPPLPCFLLLTLVSNAICQVFLFT